MLDPNTLGRVLARRAAIREALAALVHTQWSGWMLHLFRLAMPRGASTSGVLIPEELVVRWTRQLSTPYAELPENEKESDRKEADKVLALLGEFLQALDIDSLDVERLP